MSKPTSVEVAVFLLGVLIAAVCWSYLAVREEDCAKQGGVLVRGLLELRCVEARPAPSSRP